MYSLLATKGKYLDTERNVRAYLKSLSDEKIKMFYENIELTPFPILLAKEYKNRFSSKKSRKKRTRRAKVKSISNNVKSAKIKPKTKSLAFRYKKGVKIAKLRRR